MNKAGELTKRVKGVLEYFPPISTMKSCSSMNESLGSILMWVEEAKLEIFEAMRRDGMFETRKRCPETYKKLVKWFGTQKRTQKK